jgi:hypothetical protein
MIIQSKQHFQSSIHINAKTQKKCQKDSKPSLNIEKA